MAFSESVRNKVKEKSAFRCCRCHEIGIEVHHIVPSSKGGSDNIDNAAPLCPNCHSGFGENSIKRKEITQMRDWWYEVVAEKWPTPDTRAERLNNAIVNSGDQGVLLAELQEQVKALEVALKTNPSPEESREMANQLVTATRLGENVYADVNCNRCGTSIGLLVGADACPECEAPLPR